MNHQLNHDMQEAIARGFAIAAQYGNKTLEPYHILYHIIITQCPSFVLNKENTLQKLSSLLEKNRASFSKTEDVSSTTLAVLKASANLLPQFNKKLIDVNLFVYTISQVLDLGLSINESNAKMLLSKEEVSITSSYLVNMNEWVVNKDIMIIGGDSKIREISRIMQRKTKHCPLLIGNPGVGKTSLIYGLADRINKNDVSDAFADKKVYLLNTSDILINSADKGEMNRKVKELCAFLNDNTQIILCIDEIHALFQSSEGIYLLNLIKKYIEDKNVIVIGMTTIDKYKKYIQSDSSLERIFQSITIDPASKEETLTILRGLQVQYEKYHQLEITDEALQFIVDATAKFMPSKTFPDKALDILDEACALVKMKLNSKPSQLEDMQSKLSSLKLTLLSSDKNHVELNEQISVLEKQIEQTHTEWMREKALYFGTSHIKEKILVAEQKLQQAMTTQNFSAEIIKIQAEELPNLRKELQLAEEELLSLKESDNTLVFLKNTVDQEDIAEIISARTGVPINKLQQEEKTKLLNMSSILASQVINQDNAIAAITQAIQISKSGLSEDNKPLGAFMFLGSSGTGKTELAKALNNFLFDKPDSLIRLDMSEYMEKHSVSKLLGSPPGYAGCDEGGLLTEQIKKKPYSVVLMDEVEKAHKDVFNILLTMLDEGFITDSMGEVVDCRNTVVILTTNLGSAHIIQHINDPHTLSWETAKEEVIDEVKQYFRPELINRFDALLVFNTLNKTAIEKIAELQFKKLKERLAKKELNLVIESSAKEFICDKGFDPVYGARPLKRVIKQEIDSKLALEVLSEKFKSQDTIYIFCKDQQLLFSTEKKE